MTDLPESFLRGVALFNAGEFFASHEAWEELWLQATGAERAFLHALIQVAAALHHHQRGNFTGAHSVFERARQRLQQAPANVMQLETQEFLRQVEGFFAAPSALPQIRLLPFPQEFHG